MRFTLHSTYVNDLKEENPFCNVLLLWDTQKNINEFMKKQPPDVFYKKTIFKNFAIFTEKHLCWSLSQHGRFPVNIAKFLETPILENIRESMFVGCEGAGGWGRGWRRSRVIRCAWPLPRSFWVLCPFYISEKLF